MQKHLGMMGPAGPRGITRMMLTLMDTDNDGTVSLAEFQAAHERIFKAADTNKDGRLTIQEVEAFRRGRASPLSSSSPAPVIPPQSGTTQPGQPSEPSTTVKPPQ